MSEYSPSYRDTVIIPDKYNTGLSIDESGLTVVTEGGKYGGVQFAVQGTGLKIDMMYVSHNKTPGEHLCEGYDFTNFDVIQIVNPGSTDLGVRKFIFKNCVFNGIQTTTDCSIEYISFEYINCVFNKTAGARCATYLNCRFQNNDTDCMTGYHDFTVKDCYFANTSPTSYDGGHIDGVQISDGNANNILFENCRWESLEYYTEHTSYINACVMLQVESAENSSNFQLKNCILNGGGYCLYTWNKSTGTISNVSLQGVKCGQSHGYNMWYPTKTGCTFIDEDVTHLETLYVSSIIKDEANHKYKIITSNDLLTSRTLKIVTNLGTQTFSIEATHKRMEVPETVVSIDDYPVDKDIQIDSQGVKWLACFDSTSGTDVQIRYVEFEPEPIYSAILTATVLPSDCTDEVIWESNDTTIATVTPIANTNTATVTAIKAGSCIITVTCGDYSDSCNVTVQATGPIPTTGTFYAVNFTQGQFTPNTSGSTATTWTADVQKYAVSDEFNVTPGYIVEFDALGDPSDWNHTTVPALTIMFYSGSKTNPSSITDAKIVRYDGGGPRMWKADDYFSRTEYKFSGAGFLVPEGYDHARIIAYGYGSLSSDASNVDNTLIRMINGGIKWNMTSDKDTTPDGTASGLIQAAGGISGSGTTNIFLASPGHIYKALTTSSTKIQMGTGADNPPTSTTTYSDFYELSSGTSTFNAKPSDNNAEYLYVSHPSSKTLADVQRMVIRETGPTPVPVSSLVNMGEFYKVLTTETASFNSAQKVTPEGYTSTIINTPSPTGIVNVDNTTVSGKNSIYKITPLQTAGEAVITSSADGLTSTTLIYVEESFTELDEITRLRADLKWGSNKWSIVNITPWHVTSIYKVNPNTEYTVTFSGVSAGGPNMLCPIIGSDTTNPRGFGVVVNNVTIHRDATVLTSSDLTQTFTTGPNEQYLIINYMGDVTWTVTKVSSIYQHYDGIWFRWGTTWTENSSWNTDVYAVNPNSAYIINTTNFGKIECSVCPGADHLNGGSAGSINWGKTLNVQIPDGMYYLYVSYDASNTATVTATSPILCTDLTLSETEYTFNAGDPGAHNVSYVLTPTNTTQGIIVSTDNSQVASGNVGPGGIALSVGPQHGTTTIHVRCGSIHKTISVTNNA